MVVSTVGRAPPRICRRHTQTDPDSLRHRHSARVRFASANSFYRCDLRRRVNVSRGHSTFAQTGLILLASAIASRPIRIVPKQRQRAGRSKNWPDLPAPGRRFVAIVHRTNWLGNRPKNRRSQPHLRLFSSPPLVVFAPCLNPSAIMAVAPAAARLPGTAVGKGRWLHWRGSPRHSNRLHSKSAAFRHGFFRRQFIAASRA
jgi:hypothetical protein